MYVTFLYQNVLKRLVICYIYMLYYICYTTPAASSFSIVAGADSRFPQLKRQMAADHVSCRYLALIL